MFMLTLKRIMIREHTDECWQKDERL